MHSGRSPRRLLVASSVLAALVVGIARADEELSAPAETARSSTSSGRIGVETELPPVRLFTAWLAAFNSGDPERYARFLRRTFPFRGSSLGDDLVLRRSTGGYDLREVDSISGTQVAGRVRERGSGELVEFELTLELYLQSVVPGRPVAARPYRIAALDLRGGSAPPRLLPPASARCRSWAVQGSNLRPPACEAGSRLPMRAHRSLKRPG